MSNVIGLVPIAGKGTRLGLPFSKEMFPDIRADRYRPIIMYTIEAMQLAGIEHIVFTINPRRLDTLSFLGNGRQFGMHFSYCVHPIPRSLPESLNEAYHLIKDKIVVFAMPDTVISPMNHLQVLLSAHLSRTNNDVTLGCFRTDNPAKFGMVGVDGDKVARIVDKPLYGEFEWMWGTMVWQGNFTEELRKFVDESDLHSEKELILSDSLKGLIDRKRVGLHKFESGTYKDIGTFDEIIHWSYTVVSRFNTIPS